MCFRDFNFQSFEEVDKLTFYQIELLIKARNLKSVDDDYKLHLNAWLSYAAQSVEGKGSQARVKYDKFDKFYNYRAAIKAAKGESVPDELSSSPLFHTIGKILGKEE